MHYSYRYMGVDVLSDFPLDAWRAFERTPVDGGQPVCIIREARTIPGTGEAYLCCDDADHYRFFIPGVGEFRVQHGREIRVTSCPDATVEQLGLYATGSAWSTLCQQRGMFLLHASAVQIGDHAVLFCGPSGSGKSTLAAWLMRDGYTLLSDDLCRVSLDEGAAPRLTPAVDRLKLWNDALDSLEWSSDGLVSCEVRDEKFFWPAISKTDDRPREIAAIYLLDWNGAGWSRLSGRAALKRFLPAAAHRSELLAEPRLLERFYASCVKLLNQVPLWQLSRHRDISSMRETIALIRSHAQAGFADDPRSGR